MKYINTRDIETNGLYSKNFGSAPYGFERHHIIPYKTCMANGDVELACDAKINSVDLPKAIHADLHRFMSCKGYPKTEAYELVRDGHITPEKGATICMFDKIYRFVESYENWLNKSN